MSNTKIEKCAVHGEYESVMAGSIKSLEFWSSCHSCEVDREKRRADDAIRDRIGSAKIPLRFQGKRMSDYQAKTPGQKRAFDLARDYASRFDEHFKDGRSLVLAGKLGTGKTHLATSILREIIEEPFRNQGDWERNAWHSVRYATVSEIIRTLRETWATRASESDALKRLARAHLLVIDEVGLQYGSDSERTQLGELFDLRYQNILPTVVVTNCEKSQLGQYIGDRAVDRLRENGGLMAVLDWESHRGTTV